MQKAKDLIKQLKKTGYSVNEGFLQVGFALNNLGRNQVAFTAISSVNKWLENNFGTNFNFFFEENCQPCLYPKTGRFHIKDAFVFDGNLIACDYKTALSLGEVHRCKKYFYINDLKGLEKKEILPILTNPKIIKFCRCEDYKKELLKKDILVHDIVVEDFNITKILEIINGEKR